MRNFRFRTELPAASAALVDMCRSAPGIPRSVLIVGPKGGGTKTTVAAALSHLLAEQIAGLVLAVDLNPDKGTLTSRMGLPAAQVSGRIVSLVEHLSSIRFPTDLAPWLDRVGRAHILHNNHVPSQVMDQLSGQDYTDVLAKLRQFVALMVIDGGTSTNHRAFQAALGQADHLVITCLATPEGIDLTIEEIAGLMQRGHQDLISRAQVVMSVTDSRVTPAVYEKGVSYFQQRVRNVQVVPYDKYASALTPAVQFDKLGAATTLAYTNVALQVVRSVYEQGLANQFQPTPQVPVFTEDTAPQWQPPTPVQVHTQLPVQEQAQVQVQPLESTSPVPVPMLEAAPVVPMADFVRDRSAGAQPSDPTAQVNTHHCSGAELPAWMNRAAGGR